MEDEVELEVERLMNEIDPIFRKQVKNALSNIDYQQYVLAIASVYLNKAMQAARATMGDEGTVDWLLAIAESIYNDSMEDEEGGESPTIH